MAITEIVVVSDERVGRARERSTSIRKSGGSRLIDDVSATPAGSGKVVAMSR